MSMKHMLSWVPSILGLTLRTGTVGVLFLVVGIAVSGLGWITEYENCAFIALAFVAGAAACMSLVWGLLVHRGRPVAIRQLALYALLGAVIGAAGAAITYFSVPSWDRCYWLEPGGYMVALLAVPAATAFSSIRKCWRRGFVAVLAVTVLIGFSFLVAAFLVLTLPEVWGYGVFEPDVIFTFESLSLDLPLSSWIGIVAVIALLTSCGAHLGLALGGFSSFRISVPREPFARRVRRKLVAVQEYSPALIGLGMLAVSVVLAVLTAQSIIHNKRFVEYQMSSCPTIDLRTDNGQILLCLTNRGEGLLVPKAILMRCAVYDSGAPFDEVWEGLSVPLGDLSGNTIPMRRHAPDVGNPSAFYSEHGPDSRGWRLLRLDMALMKSGQDTQPLPETFETEVLGLLAGLEHLDWFSDPSTQNRNARKAAVEILLAVDSPARGGKGWVWYATVFSFGSHDSSIYVRDSGKWGRTSRELDQFLNQVLAETGVGF